MQGALSFIKSPESFGTERFRKKSVISALLGLFSKDKRLSDDPSTTAITYTASKGTVLSAQRARHEQSMMESGANMPPVTKIPDKAFSRPEHIETLSRRAKFKNNTRLIEQAKKKF
jgi:hypothetical protein